MPRPEKCSSLKLATVWESTFDRLPDSDVTGSLQLHVFLPSHYAHVTAVLSTRTSTLLVLLQSGMPGSESIYDIYMHACRQTSRHMIDIPDALCSQNHCSSLTVVMSLYAGVASSLGAKSLLAWCPRPCLWCHLWHSKCQLVTPEYYCLV